MRTPGARRRLAVPIPARASAPAPAGAGPSLRALDERAERRGDVVGALLGDEVAAPGEHLELRAHGAGRALADGEREERVAIAPQHRGRDAEHAELRGGALDR